MPNSLNSQSSPYLKQLSDQPVDWFPWEESVLAKAREIDKPLLVSIGYASCHWCSQMSRENYSDAYVASIMNRHFVCIKVDREERPDLDHLFMEASRMFNQSAGWPLHAFCMPDGSPFGCGTFFPKEDEGKGVAPWPQVLMRIAEHYRTAKNELAENGKHALANLLHSNHSYLSDPREWSARLLIEACDTLCSNHDDEEGGFTPAPKFPSSMKLDFLFGLAESEAIRRDQQKRLRLEKCLDTTLRAMAGGGLNDHLHGGFFRYCLDREWKSPHFEKMLADNALLVSTFSKAWRKFRSPLYKEVVERTLTWIWDTMGNPQSGYACSLSAESEEKEGAFYLWSEKELVEALGAKDAQPFLKSFTILSGAEGNLYLPRRQSACDSSEGEERSSFEKLTQFRAKCPHPQADAKRSCHQHALLVRALIDAGMALDRPDWLMEARNLLLWMNASFKNSKGNACSLLYPDGSKSETAYLEDHALWAESLLLFSAVSELHDLGPSQVWIEQAEEIARRMVELFKDLALPGYFICPSELAHPAPVRKKVWFDHAIPAGNSSLLRVFHLLGVLGEDWSRWNAEFEEAKGAYAKIARQAPDGIGHALGALADASIGVIRLAGPLQTLRELGEQTMQSSCRPIHYRKESELAMWINRTKIELPSDRAKEYLEEKLA